jgi:hypothetical protein
MSWLEIIGSIAALSAVILFGIRIRVEREKYKMELDFKKEELELRREQLLLQERQEEIRFSRLRELRDTARDLSNEIALALIENPEWAVKALSGARITGGALSVFGERVFHFQEEKKFLAEFLVKLLERRIRPRVSTGEVDAVALIIDSGTTLYPFCESWAQQCVKNYPTADHWTRQVLVVTNNIPGVESLIEHGRSEEDRYADLALACKILPGKPLAVYSAIVGKDTIEALRRLRNASADDLIPVKQARPGGSLKWFIIGLTTGNWIVVREGKIYPLARGEGHLEFKQTLIEVSDEIYVVGPLGKIFLNCNVDDINDELGYDESKALKSMKPYREVPTSGCEDKIRLVTTRREEGYLLQRHSDKLIALLDSMGGTEKEVGACYEDITIPVHQLPHLVPPFAMLPDSKYEQIEIEFPHRTTRNRKFLGRFFDVDLDLAR